MSTLTHINPWLIARTAPIAHPYTLVIFGHAGSCAGTYYNWAKGLMHADRVFVQLPGRETRHRESLPQDLRHTAKSIAEALKDLSSRRVILFGHSLGAALAYQTCVCSTQMRLGHVERLIVSGRKPPHIASHMNSIHDLPEPEFWDQVRKFGSHFDAVYENKELREYCSPILRADLRMNSELARVEEVRLSIPITAFRGASDPYCTAEDMQQWSRYTGGTFQSLEYPGDHFYLFDHASVVVDAIDLAIKHHRFLPKSSHLFTKSESTPSRA